MSCLVDRLSVGCWLVVGRFAGILQFQMAFFPGFFSTATVQKRAFLNVSHHDAEVFIVTEMVFVKFIVDTVPMSTWTRVYYNNTLYLAEISASRIYMYLLLGYH